MMPHFVIRCMAPIRNAWLFLRKPRHRRFAKQASSVRTKIHAFEHAGQKMNYLKKVNPYVETNIFRSIENVNLDTVVAYKKNGVRHSFLEDYESC